MAIAESEIIHSPHYYNSLVYVTKRHGEDAPETHLITRFLNAADKELFANYRIFESTYFPGTSISMAILSARKIAGELYGKIPEKTPVDDEAKGAEDICEAIFFPSVPPPSGDAGSLAGLAYGKLTRVLPLILNEQSSLKDAHIILFGLPTASTGRVSQEFMDKSSREGFKAHGALYSEALWDYLNEESLDPDLIYLNGASMGTIIAEQTANFFSYSRQDKTTLILNNPTGDQPSLLWRKGVAMGIGFMVEMLLRKGLDKSEKKLSEFESQYLDQITSLVGNESDDEQNKLRFKAYIKQTMLLIRGTPSKLPVHTHKVEGVWDSADLNPVRIYKRFIASKLKDRFGISYTVNSRLINASHWLNFDRTPWWIKRLQKIEEKRAVLNNSFDSQSN